MYSRLHLDSKEEEEAHANFLILAAKYANSIPSRALKSHLNILSNETLRMKNFGRGKWFKKNERCPYCLTNWKNGDFSLKVLPISKKQQRMKKLFRNIAKSKPLVKIEKKLLNARNIKNILLMKCHVCTKETKFKLRGAYTIVGGGGRKTSVPRSSLRSMEKKMKEKTRAGIKVKEKKSSISHLGVNSDQVHGFLSQASEGNSNQKKSPGVGHNINQNGDEDDDEIEITFERLPSGKERTLDFVELDRGKRAKKKKKKKAKKTASHGFGALNTPSSTPYNAPGDATYNTPLRAGYAMPYNMQYNTPYGIPYSIEYSTSYNNQAYATPYDASYNNQTSATPYDASYNNQTYVTSYDASYNNQTYATSYDGSYNNQTYATPYDASYNNQTYATPYDASYNNQTNATPYNASYSTIYDETNPNYENYGAVGYIPLDTGADTSKKKRKKKKKKKGASKNENLENNDSGRDLILNPFCDKVREICDLPRKKKLNKWKKLISEEENKPTQSPSFKDFLDKLQRS